MTYFEELKTAMSLLAKQQNSIFIGQAVEFEGTSLYHTLKDISVDKYFEKNISVNQRFEVPVFEATQMGMSIGMALQGYLPISIFSRINFLLSAISPLVNTLDKLSDMSQGEFNPKVIIRTAIGSKSPMDPKSQHTGDFSQAFQLMLENIPVISLNQVQDIVPAYQDAIDRKGSTILVEYMDLYNS